MEIGRTIKIKEGAIVEVQITYISSNYIAQNSIPNMSKGYYGVCYDKDRNPVEYVSLELEEEEKRPPANLAMELRKQIFEHLGI